MRLSQFFKPKPKVGIHQNFDLTALGTSKADQFTLYGAQGLVVGVMRESGPSSISFIATEANMSTDKVKMVLKDLMRSGYIQRVAVDD